VESDERGHEEEDVEIVEGVSYEGGPAVETLLHIPVLSVLVVVGLDNIEKSYYLE
jgi:hypothetical protein